MNQSQERMALSCSSCKSQRIISWNEMVDRLRDQGKLRREAKPDPQIVIQLYEQQLTDDACPNCGGSQSLESWTDIDDVWDDDVLCEICKRPIPPERLEVFPGEKRCAACKDKPAPDEQPEFCAFCGGLMTLRSSTRGGLAKYEMQCTDCGRRG